MKSEYIIDGEQYIKDHEIGNDIKEYIKGEICGSDLFFMYFIYNLFQ